MNIVQVDENGTVVPMSDTEQIAATLYIERVNVSDSREEHKRLARICRHAARAFVDEMEERR